MGRHALACQRALDAALASVTDLEAMTESIGQHPDAEDRAMS
jgi:hypothetical protein